MARISSGMWSCQFGYSSENLLRKRGQNRINLQQFIRFDPVFCERKIKKRILADNAKVKKLYDDFWHWTESFYWPNKPTLEELLWNQ